MMKKQIILIMLIFFYNFAYAEKGSIKNFTTTLSVLNKLSVNFNKHKNHFLGNGYGQYKLYRLLILNDFLLFEVESDEFGEFFCEEYDDQTINLLKWKILNQNKLNQVQSIENKCIEAHQSFKNVIYELMKENGYGEANMELYKYIESQSKTDNLNNIHILLPALYSKPDIELLELLMFEYKKHAQQESEWQTTILAARYGSKVALDNLLNSINPSEKIFLNKIMEYLLKK